MSPTVRLCSECPNACALDFIFEKCDGMDKFKLNTMVKVLDCAQGTEMMKESHEHFEGFRGKVIGCAGEYRRVKLMHGEHDVDESFAEATFSTKCLLVVRRTTQLILSFVAEALDWVAIF